MKIGNTMQISHIYNKEDRRQARYSSEWKLSKNDWKKTGNKVQLKT